MPQTEFFQEEDGIMAKPFTPKVVTANALIEGDVI